MQTKSVEASLLQVPPPHIPSRREAAVAKSTAGSSMPSGMHVPSARPRYRLTRKATEALACIPTMVGKPLCDAPDAGQPAEHTVAKKGRICAHASGGVCILWRLHLDVAPLPAYLHDYAYPEPIAFTCVALCA